MFGFGDDARKPAGPPALTGLNGKAPRPATGQEQRLYELELRVLDLEQSIVQMCFLLKQQLDRIDHNTKALDANMHKLAALTLRPPKDLLGGAGQEPN